MMTKTATAPNMIWLKLIRFLDCFAMGYVIPEFNPDES